MLGRTLEGATVGRERVSGAKLDRDRVSGAKLDRDRVSGANDERLFRVDGAKDCRSCGVDREL